MSNNEQNVNQDQLHESSLKWEIPFCELLDQIWGPGFSQKLREENLEAYQLEYYYFISLYDEPPP